MNSPLIWALGFANAPLLYGLAAAAVPIIIHLLNRRKFREVTWAAMRFLLAAIRKNQRRIRIEQWILLAVRTLVILLVVAAMAKPFLESFGMVIAGRRVHRVLVLDASLSMGYTSAGTSRFEQAKALAAQLVKASRRGDAISVILMGQPPRVVIGDPSPNLREVEKEVGELAMTHGGTDLTATFAAVDRVLEASTIGQKEVVFLTDLQAASWRPPAEAAAALKRVLARIEARQPRSVLIDLGRPGGENRAVTDLHLDAPVVTVGTPVWVRGVVRNFSATRAEGVRARLTVDGRLGPESPEEDLPPGGELPVAFRHQFSSPGESVLEVSIPEDPLKLDDRRRLVVPVRESLNVLLVDGHFQSEPYKAETDYLAQALSPTEAEGSPGQPSPLRVEVISESQLPRRELTPYDVVVLCNVAQFSPAEVSALEDYLKQGGGVVIFGGDQVLPETYNRLLYDDGKGLLPASLGPTVGDAAKKESAFGFDPIGYRHPLVAEYQGEANAVIIGLTRAHTYQYHKLMIPKGSKASVALAFETGDPAIIEAPRHRGTVVLVATSADTGWTTWPVHLSYPPIMQQIILRASAGRLSERNIRVGQPYDQSFAAPGAAAPVSVLTPKGQIVETRLQPAGGVSQFHFEQTDLSGPYQVRIGPPLNTESWFAANPDPAESNLAKLDQAALAELIPGWNFIYVSDWNNLNQDAGSVGRRGELHRPLLYAVLVLLLVESILAWKFGHNES
ncbi:MAG TPA: BatA domain-containing protein [Isosphaeraceae bacterium]|nr:BatA domain-containing protein [Isosphaeraceae bacterium]